MMHTTRLVPLLIAWSLLGGLAFAQPAPTPIPGVLKGSPTLDPVAKGKILSAVKDRFDELSASAPDRQGVLRDSLVTEVTKDRGTLSPAFIAYYSDCVSNVAIATLQVAGNISVKINVGMSVALVAAATSHASLEPATLALLTGQPEVVQIWGARAARHVLPGLLASGGGKKLADALFDVAKANPIGPIIDDTYEAMKPGPAGQGLGNVADHLIELLELRVAKLQSGCPDDLCWDFKPCNTLATDKALWPALKPDQQIRLMQAIQNAMMWAAARGDEQLKDPLIRGQCFELVNKIAGVLLVTSQLIQPQAVSLNSTAQSIQLHTASMLRVNSVNLMGEVKGLPAAIQAISAFKGKVKETPPAEPWVKP
jgi:hypothetical protein